MEESEKANIDIMIREYDMLRVLRHFLIARVDYAKNIMRYTEIPQYRIKEYLKRLESMGYLSIYTNTSIKRTDAKLKKSPEVHKHHTYYEINREGEQILKEITPKYYVKNIGLENLEMLCSRKNRKQNPEKVKDLLQMGLIDKCYDLTEIGRDVFNEARRMQMIRCQDQN